MLGHRHITFREAQKSFYLPWRSKGIKFMFSKKAKKIDKIFTLIWHLISVKSMVKILSFFAAFLEYMNFTKDFVSLHNRLLVLSQNGIIHTFPLQIY